MTTSVITHVLGTVALLIMMLSAGSVYTIFSKFVTDKAYDSEIDETSQQIGLQIIQLASLAEHSNQGYLIKSLKLPEVIGNFGYNVSIVGGGGATGGSSTVTGPASSVVNPGGWTNPGNVFTSNNVYAEATANNQVVDYAGFGFNVPAGYTITSVKVMVEHYEDPSGRRYIEFQMSTNGGSSFLSTIHNLPVRAGGGNEGTDTTDVTSDTSWASTTVNSVAVRLTSKQTQGGSPPSYQRVDYITVEVTYNPPPPPSEVFQVSVASDKPGLSTVNFTLPWDRNAKVVTDSSFTVPGVQNLNKLYSGVKNPVTWTYSNSTHILFGLGKRTG